MGVEDSYNFRRVSDTVTTSGVIAANELAGLRSDGYEVVVNLLPDSSEHAVAGEADVVEAQGIEYVHIPVDFAAPTSEQFQQFAAVMERHAGKSIHVHCAANYRVSAFYALYAIRNGTWSDEQADEHVHSIWTPDAVWEEFIAAERERAADSRRR